MTDEQEPFIFDWTVLNSKMPKVVPRPPDDDGVGPLSQPTAVKVADLQDINNIYYTPDPFSPPIHVSVERRKVDKVLEVLEDTAHRLRALDGIDVTFAVHADHRGRVEGELTIREPIWRKEARA